MLGPALLAVVLCAALAPGGVLAGTPATTANDVCASNANPCNVTSIFDVTDGAILDFGVRSVNVTGAGQFNFGRGSGKIYSGPFTASTTNPVIDANGPGAVSGTDSGVVVLKARRLCSSDSPKVPCVKETDCQLGACDTRRCTGDPKRTCLSDANCSIGTCGITKRCSGSVTAVFCASNADCSFGTCPAQLTCHNLSDNPVNCASNTDCNYGTCTVGTASITMGGPIAGTSRGCWDR